MLHDRQSHHETRAALSASCPKRRRTPCSLCQRAPRRNRVGSLLITRSACGAILRESRRVAFADQFHNPLAESVGCGTITPLDDLYVLRLAVDLDREAVTADLWFCRKCRPRLTV